MAYITCEDLALGYEGKAVTEHIHFTVNKGDYLCIIGENGAGKSTLMKTLLRLIQPISGTIETGDGLSAYEVGYLPLLDEPVAGLDPKVTAEMYQLIEQLNKSGVTIIMVSHDIQAALKYASHILQIGKKQLYFGSSKDYLESDAWKLLEGTEEKDNE